MSYLNWSEISRELTKGHRSQVNQNYEGKGKMYINVVNDIKDIEKLIDMRIKAFKIANKEPEGLSEAIQEIEVIDNIKQSMV